MISAKAKFDELDFDQNVGSLGDAIENVRTALKDGDLEDAELQIDEAIEHALEISNDLASLRRHLVAEREQRA